MRRITMMGAQWQPETQTGETLTFERCKGGYFSTDDRYGLRVVGRTGQEGTPTPDTPVAIRCVKAGTRIRCRGKNLISTNTISATYTGRFVSLLIDSDVINPLLGKQLTVSVENPYADIQIGFFIIGDVPSAATSGYWASGYSESGASSRTFTLPDAVNGQYYAQIRFYRPAGADGTTRTFSGIRLEIGATAGAFEPYVEPAEITVPCDLYEGDVWFPASGLVERYSRKALTGSGNFRMIYYSGNGSKHWLRYSLATNSDRVLDVDRSVYCDKIRAEGTLTSSTSVAAYASMAMLTVSDPLFSQLGFSEGTTKDEYQSVMDAWLAENPLTFVYVATAPTVEQYTPQALPATAGTVVVEQIPADISGELTATVLTRRLPHIRDSRDAEN